MKKTITLALFIGGVLIGFQNLPFRDVDRFKVPEGFVVEEVYAPEEAGTIVAITFDSQGNLVLAREDSFVVTLVDPDGDGRFEERVFTDQVRTSQGIFFDGPDLIIVGEGPDEVVGMYRVADEDGDGKGDRVERMERVVGAMGDHGPHQPFFGPDGYLYWTLGNMAQPWSAHAPLSPYTDYSEGVLALTRLDPRGHASQYRIPGGTFVRKRIRTAADAPRGSGRSGGPGRAEADAGWELVVGGFRNQYDGAFNMMGELFTFDSDMEWDRDLPWYRPTRTIHAVPGGDYGWRSGSRKLPPHYIDTLPGTEDQGRGSPTGVIFYQSYSYPREYRDAFLQADWSRGRILVGRLTRDGASYTQQSENFVYGEPLNVTDIEVGPDGNVYFALGGRDTQGGVYRVVYTGPTPMTRPEASDPIEEVLTLPQPRSAWSRAAAARIRDEMGISEWQQVLTAVVRDSQAQPERRVRAMELLQVFGPGLDENVLVPLGGDPSWEVRAASTYYLGMKQSPSARRALAERLKDTDPFVQRRAAEALIRTGIHPAENVPVSAVEDVMPLLSSPDRFVRYAAKEVLRRINRNEWQEAALRAESYPQAPMALLAYVETIDEPNVKDVTLLIERELELLKANPADSELLDLLRVMQLTMLNDQGLTFSGGRRRPNGERERGEYEQIADLLLARFPANDPALNRDIARTMVYLQPEEAVGKMAAELDNPENDREQQIFLAYALSNMKTGWDEGSQEMLLSWFEKVHREGWKGGASFSGYINGMKDDFLAHVPDTFRALAAERLEALESQQVAAMPGPGGFQATISDEELEEELIYNPRNFEGDPSKGAVAYEKALCASCHTFGPIGTEFGPDLTTIGQRFTRQDLVRAVTRPSETVSDLWQVETITKTDGETVSGTIYNEDGQSVIVQIPAGPQVTIPKSQIQSRERSNVSPMPEGLLSLLTSQERSSLFMFLEAGPSAIPDSMLSAR